tara:strand:+ start:3056 stop:3892 length:837 start_codon:yes stop_codon:yes gene_type:complete
MISDKKIKLLEDGLILIRSFFDKKEIELILHDAKNIFKNQFKEVGLLDPNNWNVSQKEFNECLYQLFKQDRNRFINCGKQIQHLISLHRLGVNKRLIELLNELGLENPNICTRPVLFFNHPKLATDAIYNKVEPHQDWKSMQGSINSLVIWTPLVDMNEELGSVKFLSKSHKKGLVTDRIKNGFGIVNLNEKEEELMTSFNMKVGDIVIFSSLLIHESGDNVTDSPRWSCHFRFNDLSDSSFIKRSYPNPYIYRPIDEMITANFPLPDDVNEYLNKKA